MSAMTHIHKHPKTGVYRIRRAIPEAARFAFDNKREYIETLGTKVFKEAQSVAYPKLTWLQSRIDNAICGTLYDTEAHAHSAAVNFIEWDEKNGGNGQYPFDTPYIFDDEEDFLNKLTLYCDECGIPTDGNAFDEIRLAVENEISNVYEPTPKPTPLNSTRSQPHVDDDDITEHITLSQLCEKLVEYKLSYEGKTERDARTTYDYLIEIHGDMYLTNIRLKHIREFRDILLKQPVTGRTNEIKAMPLKEMAEMAWDHTVSKATVERRLGHIGQGFDLAISEGWAKDNPRTGLMVKVTPTSKTVKRRDFTSEEIKRLFASPLFGTCQGDRKEAQAGNIAIRDYRYWLPYVGFFTGCRLSELCQLEKKNLKIKMLNCVLQNNPLTQALPLEKHC